MFKLRKETEHQVIAQERLYLNADKSRVVKEGDKDAAFLLAAVGQPIAAGVAKRLGLIGEEVKPEAQSAAPERRINRRASVEATR